MSTSALKYAVRDVLRSKLSTWVAAPEHDIRIMGGPEPDPRSGLLFVSVYGFSDVNQGPQDGYYLDEVYSWHVHVSMRVQWLSKYHVAETWLDDPDRGLEFLKEQVKSLHGNFQIASLANSLSSGGSSGFVEGTMVTFRDSTPPIRRDQTWWGASTRTKMTVPANPAGWSSDLVFSGPTRIRDVNEIGSF